VKPDRIDWWDGTAYEGPADTAVPAPLGRLPLFLRAGAIVPMLRPGVDTLSPATDPGVDSYDTDPGRLWVRVVPAATDRFDLHDGGSIEVRGGPTVELDATAGDAFEGWLFEVDWTNRDGAVDAAGPTAVTIDGGAADEVALPADGLAEGCGCWAFDAARGVVWVDAAAAAAVAIELR